MKKLLKSTHHVVDADGSVTDVGQRLERQQRRIRHCHLHNAAIKPIVRHLTRGVVYQDTSRINNAADVPAGDEREITASDCIVGAVGLLLHTDRIRVKLRRLRGILRDTEVARAEKVGGIGKLNPAV